MLLVLTTPANVMAGNAFYLIICQADVKLSMAKWDVFPTTYSFECRSAPRWQHCHRLLGVQMSRNTLGELHHNSASWLNQDDVYKQVYCGRQFNKGLSTQICSCVFRRCEGSLMAGLEHSFANAITLLYYCPTFCLACSTPEWYF